MSTETHKMLLERYDAISEDGGIDGFEPEFVEVNGVRTRYYDVGSGDPLVLLHGGSWYGSASANTWHRNFPGLSEHFRVIAPDRLGNGMTDAPEDPEDFTYDTELDHILTLLLDTLDLDSFHLAGQSRGGGLAGRIAVEHPEKVDTLVVANSSTLSPEAGDYDSRRNRLYRNGPTDTTDPEYYRYNGEQLSYRTDHITDEYVQTVAYMANRPKAKRVDEIFGRTGAQNMWKDQGGRWFDSLTAHLQLTHERILDGVLTMPTLLWYGIDDPTVPIRATQALYDMIAQHNPDVRMRIVNHAGHSCYREYPDEFNHDVRSFVDYWHR